MLCLHYFLFELCSFLCCLRYCFLQNLFNPSHFSNSLLGKLHLEQNSLLSTKVGLKHFLLLKHELQSLLAIILNLVLLLPQLIPLDQLVFLLMFILSRPDFIVAFNLNFITFTLMLKLDLLNYLLLEACKHLFIVDLRIPEFVLGLNFNRVFNCSNFVWDFNLKIGFIYFVLYLIFLGLGLELKSFVGNQRFIFWLNSEKCGIPLLLHFFSKRLSVLSKLLFKLLFFLV